MFLFKRKLQFLLPVFRRTLWDGSTLMLKAHKGNMNEPVYSTTRTGHNWHLQPDIEAEPLLQQFEESAGSGGYECFPLCKTNLLFWAVKDQSFDVQGQPNTAAHQSPITPTYLYTSPEERQIAYFPITCAGAGAHDICSASVASCSPCNLTYGSLDVLWLGRADPTQHALEPAVVPHLSACELWQPQTDS